MNLFLSKERGEHIYPRTTVSVTRTTRDDTYDGLSVAWQEPGMSWSVTAVSDPSLPMIILPRESDNPSYALAHSRGVTVN